MNILFFIILTLTLFVVQTIILPSVSFFPQCFDLMIMVVLYISMLARRHLALLPIIFIGAVMDSISGVPFFLHIFSYLWIYFIVQLVRQFLFAQSLVFLLAISIVSVAIQQGLIVLSILIQQGSEAVLNLDFGMFIRQVFWGMILIGPGIWLMNISRVNFLAVTRMIKKQVTRKYRGEL